tara:strand:+ start:76 stop:246 length:171 start_codon:yes stop_codon:yes gene_type:complete
MDLPITDQDLDTIVKALALGGDARLYHLLKEVREDRGIGVKVSLNTEKYQPGECDI